jgi:5-carboxymethyl-2-hydroxymuconate isomerase
VQLQQRPGARAEIEARLKILAGRDEELDRRPTFDEICAWLPA